MNAKQQAFLEHYLQCWNASEAARLAGYSEKAAGAIGHKLLKNAEISRAYKERLAELHMGSDEILKRLAEQARGSLDGFVTDRGNIDLAAAKQSGALKLAKRIKTQTGKVDSIEVELHDPQRAMELLGKHLALFGGLSGDVNDAIEQLMARLVAGGKAETGTATSEGSQPAGSTGAPSAGSGGLLD